MVQELYQNHDAEVRPFLLNKISSFGCIGGDRAKTAGIDGSIDGRWAAGRRGALPHPLGTL